MRDLLTVGEVAEKLHGNLHTKYAWERAVLKHSSTVTEEDDF